MLPSSPIGGPQVDPKALRAANLVQLLHMVKDPRDPRGVRHQAAAVLALALGAVAAGARSFKAIGEWALDVGEQVLEHLGLGGSAPSEPTIRRLVAALDAAMLSALFGAWAMVRWTVVGGRKVVAIDGKTARGAKNGPNGAPHLVAALTHGSGLVVGQVQVGAKTNEIPAARDLLALFDLGGVVVTLDAMHTQTDTAEFITERGADYVLTVKGNQPKLRDKLAALPWGKIPGHRHTGRGHGRTVTRTVKALVKPAWIEFPGCAQVLQVRRTSTIKGKRTVEVVYLICSAPMEDAPPETVAAWVQGHWGVETRLHWVRDVTYDEDRSQVRVGNAPTVMAAIRNIAITVLRILGWDNIAEATRHHSRDCHRVANLLLTS
jgi:predicted transposase YbfD/YdcC